MFPLLQQQETISSVKTDSLTDKTNHNNNTAAALTTLLEFTLKCLQTCQRPNKK